MSNPVAPITDASSGYPTSSHLNAKPQVIFWFKIYAGLLGLIYIVVTIVGLAMILMDVNDPETPPWFFKFMGSIFLVGGLLLAIAALLPFYFRPKPWVWVYDLVVICIGLTSVCLWPICIPLLIYWLKPETKRSFGRLR